MPIKLKKQVKSILMVLKDKKSECVAKDLALELNIDYIVLMSSINDLKDQKLADFKEIEINQVSLNEEGLKYLKNGLPERQILQILLKENIKEISINEFLNKSALDKSIFYIGISNMKKNRWIASSKATGENKVFLMDKEYPETDLEQFLKKFEEKENLNVQSLNKKELKQVDILNKRKLIKKEKRTTRIIYLTEKGKKIDPSKIVTLTQVSKITSEMLSSRTWNNYELKPFDVSKPGPLLKAGKLHPMIKLINEIREIFLSMGFTEIRGPIIESAFYNFDALFQPQDHPAREMQDTFYLNNPKVAKLPESDRVKA
ncbi:MAG: hypothetical protein ACFE9M_10255, partial [Promethearchaeota archaeon]